MTKITITLKCIMITIVATMVFNACTIIVNDSCSFTNPKEEPQMSYETPTVTRLTPSQARAKMDAHPDAIILDVRTQDEFDTQRIPGAILLPDFEVEARAASVLPDRDALILIYCRSGRRSLNSANLLASMGYTNVYDFGGILDWPYESE